MQKKLHFSCNNTGFYSQRKKVRMTNNLALMCIRSIWVVSLGDRVGLLTVMRKQRNLTGMKNLRSCRRVDLGKN